MTKPAISPNFTIDDIHKIREYNWEQTKNLPAEAQSDYYKRKADAFLKEAGIVLKEKSAVYRKAL